MILTDASLQIIPDSREDKTLQAILISNGKSATASVPSGKSRGLREAATIDPTTAMSKFTSFKGQMVGKDFLSLEAFDNFLISLDGTPQKSNLGGNMILALSMAFVKLQSRVENLEPYQLIAKIAGQNIARLPLCFYNLIEGGVHTPPGDLPYQEYLYIPSSPPKQSLEQVNKFIEFLGIEIQGKFGSLKQGDEGGFTIPSTNPEEGLLVLQRVKELTKQEGRFALDVAASTFLENGSYNLAGKIKSKDDLLSYYELITNNYKLLSIEDPFAENDWEGFATITQQLGEKVWIIGDDLTTTNPEQVKLAGQKKAVNGMIIKPNQIGSVTETIKAALLAKSFGWKIIVSHRSGETMDTFIADLAVGLQADGLKAGCPLQKERLVKYQRLIEIEEIQLKKFSLI